MCRLGICLIDFESSNSRFGRFGRFSILSEPSAPKGRNVGRLRIERFSLSSCWIQSCCLKNSVFDWKTPVTTNMKIIVPQETRKVKMPSKAGSFQRYVKVPDEWNIFYFRYLWHCLSQLLSVRLKIYFPLLSVKHHNLENNDCVNGYYNFLSKKLFEINWHGLSETWNWKDRAMCLVHRRLAPSLFPLSVSISYFLCKTLIKEADLEQV